MTAHVSGWSWRHAVRDALTLAGLIYIVAVWLGVAPYAPPIFDYGPMFDARGFWAAWDGGLYNIPWGEYEAYVYSPAFAQLLWPFTLLPWAAFAALWTIAAIACLVWMRVPWMLAFPGVIDDILRGNIHVFLAAMVVLGFRFAGAYAFGILTKVTPGIGLAWFAFRREWRPLGIGLGVTALIVGVSFVFSSELWFEWFQLLGAASDDVARIQVLPLPLVARLPIALVLIAVGAWKDRAWLVPIGVMLALPNVWTSSTALLAAVPALWSYRTARREDHAHSPDGPVAD